MKEQLTRAAEIALDAATVALPAIAGVFFAFSAGGHDALAQNATAQVARQHEIHERDINAVPALIFEAVAIGNGIRLAARRKSSEA